MAAKTSANLGVMIFLAIVSLLALGLFVTSIIFFARVQRLTNDLALRQADLDAAVRANERDDRWEELKRQAGNRAGVVRYLDESLQEVGGLVTGTRRDTSAALVEKIKAAAGPDQTPLLQIISNQQNDIGSLTSRLKDAEQAREAARADLLASVERVKALEAEHRETIASLNAEIDSYKEGATRYRESVEETKADMSTRVSSIRSEADSAIAALESQNDQMQQDLLIANDQLRRLRVERSSETLRPQFEAALVDARVAGVVPAAKQVYLDIGRKDRVVLGMSFEVYSSATAIQPGENNEYAPGKATVEIIRIVDDRSSIARIVRETPGNPIISGDVLANAIYDPNKVYSFVIFGNFDTDKDGIATPQEIQDIRGLVESWNGRITDEISGDTDFLVLGERPILPPQPRPTDPVELTERYILLRQQAAKYDEFFEKSSQAGIPVLNQNRLYTLTGADRR